MPQFHYDPQQGGAQTAMVMVRPVGGGRYLAEANDSGMAFHISSEVLHPMPPTITPEQEAVLRAAEAQEQSTQNAHGGKWSAYMATNEAVRAWHASLTPVDPVAEVKAAWHELLRNRSFQHDAVGRMSNAVNALEAKS